MNHGTFFSLGTINNREHPYTTSAKGLVEYVGLENVSFADVQYCIYADIVSGRVKKRSKLMLT